MAHRVPRSKRGGIAVELFRGPNLPTKFFDSHMAANVQGKGCAEDHAPRTLRRRERLRYGDNPNNGSSFASMWVAISNASMAPC